MSYEIPSQLEYKEKIIFGLTFDQLIYAVILAPICLFILFKTSLNQYIRWSLASILTVAAISFMFFDLRKSAIDWLGFLRIRKLRNNSDAMIKFLEVRQIKDGILRTKDNKLAFLKIEPVNFSIKTEQEQELITQNFRKFLNSLDFPVQILMDTVPINLNEYLSAMEKRISQKHIENFKEYRQHLSSIVNDGKIMNRHFYLAIAEKDNLDIQMALCNDRLSNLNLAVKRLDDKEISKLVYKFFEGDSITFCPDRIENRINLIKINEKCNRIVAAVGYPRLVESGFLDRIVRAKGDFDLSIHIVPYEIERQMLILNKELQKQRADLYAAELKSVINPSLEIQYKDTRATLENLQKGSEKLFNVSLYVNCRADDETQLDRLTRVIQSELNSLMIIPKIPFFRMVQGFKSVAPLGTDRLDYKRNITSNALSAFFPFTSPFLRVDDTGIWLGQNKNNIPIVRDVFKLSNPNGCILATSGSGKSYLAKLLIARHILNGTKVIIIDPQSEYTCLVRKFNGEIISLQRTSKTIINPLDLMEHDYAEKRLSLMDLMQVMLGELSEPQKCFIDKALTIAYERKGITSDSCTWSNKPPKLTDLNEALESLEKKATTLEKPTVQSLINRLSVYVDGVFSFLNKETHIKFTNDLVCFDIGEMPKQVKPVIMFLVLDYVYMKMKRSLDRKLLVVDESWSLLERAEDASYIFEIVKTCRKFNLGLLLINQEVEGLLNSKAGKSVLANSAYTILMRQKPSVMKYMQEAFDLSKAEINFLLTASVGEGILIMENDHSELKVIASPKEHETITTNPDERLATIAVSEKKEVEIKVNEEQGIYSHNVLNLDEVKYLVSKGYKESVQFNIFSKQKERFLLRPRYNEGATHFFVVMQIYHYIRQFTDKVKLYETIKPDIVFELEGKVWAIEIETGIVRKRTISAFLEKVKSLNQCYGDNWFFVLTDKNHIPQYTEHGRCFTKINIAKHLETLFMSADEMAQEGLRTEYLAT